MDLVIKFCRYVDFVLAEWPERGRARRRLARMSDRELADIGISRGDIQSIVEGRYVRSMRDGS